MPIRFQCKCGRAFKVADEYAGKRTRCPSCGLALIIPEAHQEPSAAPPAAASKAPQASHPKLELAPTPPKNVAESPAGTELQLEVERFGIGGKTLGPEDSVPPKEPMAEPEPTTPQPPEKPAESPPAATQAAETIPVEAPPESKKCPKCGAAVAADAVICVECGTNLAVSTAPQQARGGFLKTHRTFLIFVGAALLLLAALVGAALVLVSKLRAPDESAVAVPPTTTVPPPAQQPQPDKQAEEKPPPPEVQWTGFKDPACVSRDAIVRVGRRLLAWMAETGRAPASLSEAGIGDEEANRYVYVGAEAAGSKRFRPLLYEATPHAPGRQYVFFSDGSARLVSPSDLSSILLTKTSDGWMTAADTALLASLAPQLRVSNPKLAALQVSVDGKPVATVPRGEIRTITMPAGDRQIQLAAGSKSESFKLQVRPGLVYLFSLPKHQDLPYIPLRLYRASMSETASDYVVEKYDDSPLIRALRGPHERVVFSEVGGRMAIPLDMRSLSGWIERGPLEIRGLGKSPILVSEIGRLEEGEVTYRKAASWTYRRTQLGTLRMEVVPDTRIAEFGRLKLAQGQRSPARPGEPPEMSAPGVEPGFPGGTPPQQQARQRLAFPDMWHRPGPDCQGLTPLIRQIAPAVTDVLLRCARQAEVKPAGPAMQEPAAGPMPGPVPAPTTEPDRPGTAPREAALLPPDKAIPAEEIRLPTLLAALAFYANPAAVPELSALYEKIPGGSEGYGELLLALGRCGGSASLAQIRTAAPQAQIAAATAFSMIDDPAARKALAEIVSGWSGSHVAETIRAWPNIAGPDSRRTFVEALAAGNPALLDDVTTLNALMKFEPHSLERVLVARVVPVSGAEAAAAPKSTEAKPEAPPGETPAGMPPVAGTPASWLLLARMKNTDAVSYFAKLLSGADAQKKQYALAALAEVRDESLAPVLIPRLKDKDVTIRRGAAVALVATGTAEAVKALADAMDTDLALQAIVDAAPAVASAVGREEVAELLAKMLVAVSKEAKSPQPGGQPGEGESGGSPIPSGTPSGAPGQPPETYLPGNTAASPLAILKALSKLGVRSAAVMNAIEAARKSADPAVRLAAIEAMFEPGGRSLVRGVLKLTPLRWAALSAEGGPHAAYASAAQEALKDAEALVRVGGAKMLSRAPLANAMPLIDAALKDANAEVRAAALDALADLKGDDPRIGKAIAAALADSNPLVVAAGARAAMKRKESTVGEQLLAALNQPSVRATADQAGAVPALAEAVSVLRVRGATSALVLLLADANTEVRLAAIRALGRLRDPSSVQALSGVAMDKEAIVAAAALAALGEFSDVAAVNALSALLQKPDLPADLRQKALALMVARCTTLGPYAEWSERGPRLTEADLDALLGIASVARPTTKAGMIRIARRHLGGSNAEVRKRAAAILGMCADHPEAREALLAELEPEKDVASIAPAAAEALRRMGDPTKLENYFFRLYSQLVQGRFGKLEENDSIRLRAAIVQAVVNSGGGDNAARIIRWMMNIERNEELTIALITALGSIPSPQSVRYLAEFNVRRETQAVAVVAALARVGHLSRETAVEALQKFMRGQQYPPEISALAADTLDEIEARSS